jgi:hypothetical protein
MNARDAVEGGRFPRTVRPDQSGERTRLDIEARVVDRGQPTELFPEVTDPERAAGRRLARRTLDL